MYLFCPRLYSDCGCTIAQCVLCLYILYSVLAWPAHVMYRSYPRLYSHCAYVPLHRVYCACTPCTLVWPGSTGNVPILPVFVLVLWLYHCTVCTVLVPLVQCSGMAGTGNVPILPVYVLVLCVYHCTVCTMLVPLVQWFGMASTGNVPIFPVFILVLCGGWQPWVIYTLYITHHGWILLCNTWHYGLYSVLLLVLYNTLLLLLQASKHTNTVSPLV